MTKQVTPEELSTMSVIDVCNNLGYAEWRNQPQVFLNAKKEAVKRIQSGETSVEDCVAIAQMAIRSSQRSSEDKRQMLNGLMKKVE